MVTINYERRELKKCTLELTLPAYIASENTYESGGAYNEYTALLSDGRCCTVTEDRDADGTVSWVLESSARPAQFDYAVFDPEAPKDDRRGKPSTAEVFKAKFAEALTAIGPIE